MTPTLAVHPEFGSSNPCIHYSMVFLFVSNTNNLNNLAQTKKMGYTIISVTQPRNYHVDYPRADRSIPNGTVKGYD